MVNESAWLLALSACCFCLALACWDCRRLPAPWPCQSRDVTLLQYYSTSNGCRNGQWPPRGVNQWHLASKNHRANVEPIGINVWCLGRPWRPKLGRSWKQWEESGDSTRVRPSSPPCVTRSCLTTLKDLWLLSESTTRSSLRLGRCRTAEPAEQQNDL